jgi:hypothetical protein
MFSCYLKLEQLPEEVKNRHKIRLGARVPRFDVTAVAGYYKPLETLKNGKGMIFFYLNKTFGIINSSDVRRADCYLQGKDSINFSSIYTLDGLFEPNSQSIIAHGTPPDMELLSPKFIKGTKIDRPNPFYENGDDGYLFIIAKDYKTIEILIVEGGRYRITGIAKQLADGQFEAALKQMRGTAKPVFLY